MSYPDAVSHHAHEDIFVKQYPNTWNHPPCKCGWAQLWLDGWLPLQKLLLGQQVLLSSCLLPRLTHTAAASAHTQLLGLCWTISPLITRCISSSCFLGTVVSAGVVQSGTTVPSTSCWLGRPEEERWGDRRLRLSTLKCIRKISYDNLTCSVTQI